MGQRICVTGASGQAGRAVVRELSEHGYDVVATDIAVTREDLESGMLRADLTDYGQALEALLGPKATWWPVAAAGSHCRGRTAEPGHRVAGRGSRIAAGSVGCCAAGNDRPGGIACSTWCASACPGSAAGASGERRAATSSAASPAKKAVF
jgi:hypothetical protein